MKTKKVMKNTVKDIGMFSVGSVTLGAGAVAAGSLGSGYAAGLSTMGSFMPVIGTVVMMKPMVGMLGNTMNQLPKPKKRKMRYK